MGRVVITNKHSGRGTLLPLGTIDQGIEIEVESWDGSQSFKATTQDQGYFFIANIPSNTYYVSAVVVERRGGDRFETSRLGVRGLTFTPVPGKIGIAGTLLVEVSEQGTLSARESREDEEAKTYFLKKHGGSSWASREFVSVGTRPIVDTRFAQTDLPSRVSIPFQRRGPVLIVQTTLNDRVSGSFIVDTGASGTMISRTMAGRLGIDLGKKHPTVLVQTPGGMITVPLIVLESVDVGGMKVRDLTVGVHDVFPDPTLTGLLGLNFFNYFDVHIDNAKGLLVLEGKGGSTPQMGPQIAEEKAMRRVDSKQVVRPGLKADKPEWKVGYEWRYAWKGPTGSGTLTREIVRDDSFESVPSYVVRTGRNESFYAKDMLSSLAIMSRGRLVSKNSPPYQVYSWPLEVGKEWRNTYTRENVEEKSSQNLDFRMVVTGVEQVTVPAGSFEAFKIEVYLISGGNLLMEYWYSPKAKWNVKSRTYLQASVREEELISYKVD